MILLTRSELRGIGERFSPIGRRLIPQYSLGVHRLMPIRPRLFCDGVRHYANSAQDSGPNNSQSDTVFCVIFYAI
jgi:hypothetical protein